LRQLVPFDPGIEYTLFMKDEFDPGFPFPNMRVTILQRPGSYFVWQNTHLRSAVNRGHFDLFWSPNYTIPFALRVPSLVTVHDLSWKALPADYPGWNRVYKNITAHYGLKKARRVFTDSDFAKEEIIRRTAIAEGKVCRIHLAVDEQFQHVEQEGLESFSSRYGLTGKRVIGFLGSLFPRRHVQEALAAFELVRHRYPDTRLFVVGENFGSAAQAKLLSAPGIIWQRRIPEKDLNAFYSSLALFLYLSDYEGFGLPPMEALNCGTVSLLLPRSSLAELYQHLALFVDAPEPVRIAEAIIAFLEQGEAKRQSILACWQTQRDYYSWLRVAQEYHRELLSQK